MTLWDTLPDEWQAKLKHLKPKIDQISIKLQSEEQINPSQKNIFRALTTNPKDIRVVILGQDPYPNPALAMGLAFSVPEKEIVPPSLRNIQKELKSDLGIEIGNDLRNTCNDTHRNTSRSKCPLKFWWNYKHSNRQKTKCKCSERTIY